MRSGGSELLTLPEKNPPVSPNRRGEPRAAGEPAPIEFREPVLIR